MKEVSGEIEYKGKKYKLLFNLNVMEEIQEEYGSVEAWGAKCEPKKGEPNVKALIFGFTAMLNEGIEISNEENKEKAPLFTLKQVGRIISELGTQQAVMALNDTVIKSTQNPVKNA